MWWHVQCLVYLSLVSSDLDLIIIGLSTRGANLHAAYAHFFVSFCCTSSIQSFQGRLFDATLVVINSQCYKEHHSKVSFQSVLGFVSHWVSSNHD